MRPPEMWDPNFDLRAFIERMESAKVRRRRHLFGLCVATILVSTGFAKAGAYWAPDTGWLALGYLLVGQIGLFVFQYFAGELRLMRERDEA